MTNLNATTPRPGHYISNESEDCGGEEGGCGEDEGYMEIVAEEEVGLVVESVTGEGRIMAKSVEEAEQAEEAEILRDEIT